MNDTPAPRWPTALAAGSCAVLFAVAVNRTTDGLTAWTFEDRRLAAVARGELRAAPRALVDAAHRRFVVFDRGASPSDVWVVDFIYTRCPSVCQALGAEHFRMQSRLPPPREGVARVRLLSITLDPEHDDPAALAAHARLHRADPVHWTLATPMTREAGQAMRRELGVIVIPDGLGGFVHNAGLHLIDGDGRLRAVFPHEQWELALAEAVRLAGGAPPHEAGATGAPS